MKHLQRAHSFNKIDEEKNQSSNEQHLQIDADENSCSNQNTSVDNVSCEIMNMVFDSNVTEMDSMENQLNEQISKQIVKMWNIATVHGEHLDCGVQCTNTDDLHISVDVVQVHGNGDCLLSSAAHQLFGKDINSPEHTILTDTLSANVVKHIQEHYEDFFLYSWACIRIIYKRLLPLILAVIRTDLMTLLILMTHANISLINV